jgi:hypothetical protein
MKNLVKKFQSLKSATFISINNYLASTSGELANHVVNVNISVQNAKESDLQKLKNCTPADLKSIATATGISFETVSLAYSEMLTSAIRNLSENKEDRTAQSQGQTGAYFNITPAIRVHLDTMTVHVFGQAISKTVLIKGEYKSVNSSDKTLAKNAIKKTLELRSDKFRDFILGNADALKVNGDTILIVR